MQEEIELLHANFQKALPPDGSTTLSLEDFKAHTRHIVAISRVGRAHGQIPTRGNVVEMGVECAGVFFVG